MMGSPMARWVTDRELRLRAIKVALTAWALGLLTGLVIASSSGAW